MLIFLSEIFHKVFHMFTSPFSFHLVIIVMRTNSVLRFCCLRQRLWACDVARNLVALFPYIICSYKYQARSFERPAGIKVKLPRSLINFTLSMIWSFDRILRKQSLVGNSGKDHTLLGFLVLHQKVVLRISKCAVLYEIDVLDF